MKKRILGIFLVICLLIGSIPAVLAADHPENSSQNQNTIDSIQAQLSKPNFSATKQLPSLNSNNVSRSKSLPDEKAGTPYGLFIPSLSMVSQTSVIGTTMKLHYTLLSNGYSSQQYNIFIYHGDDLDTSSYVQYLSNYYPSSSDMYDGIITWDTTGAPSGKYSVATFTSYYSGGEWQIIEETFSLTNVYLSYSAIPLSSIGLYDDMNAKTPHSSVVLNAGNSVKYVLKFNPINTTADRDIFCTSSNAAIATAFESSGIIFIDAVSPGTAYVTVKAGGKSTSLAVIVPDPNSVLPFYDVTTHDWYYSSVLWAVQNNITAGTSPTMFSPTLSCTRAQIVQFLWNKNGRPAPTSSYNPFVDVKSTSWYYNAVLWAVENHVTSGTSANKFSPESNCTRAQVVRFIWNAQGQPKFEATNNPFTDVKPTAWYYNAVQWAVANRVTTGTSATKFSPDAVCNRAQIVRFLWNEAGNPSV